MAIAQQPAPPMKSHLPKDGFLADNFRHEAGNGIFK